MVLATLPFVMTRNHCDCAVSQISSNGDSMLRQEDAGACGPSERMTPRPLSDAVREGLTQPDRPMPQILYIMGTGRSGTTILEVLLANNPGVAGVGEFKHIFRHGFIHNRICSCGKPADVCDVWSRVFQQTGWNDEDCEKLARLVDQIERHANFLPLWLGVYDKRQMDSYRATHEALFKAVALNARAAVIVDSSKYQSRGLALSKLFPGKVKVLFITRSAKTLIEAFQKTDEKDQIRTKSAVGTTVYFLYVLFCMWLVRLQLKQDCLAVRFEDLKRDPSSVLGTIEAWSGISMGSARRKLETGEFFEVGHIISGNRLRKNRVIKFDVNPAEASPPGSMRLSVAGALETVRNFLKF